MDLERCERGSLAEVQCSIDNSLFRSFLSVPNLFLNKLNKQKTPISKLEVDGLPEGRHHI